MTPTISSALSLTMIITILAFHPAAGHSQSSLNPSSSQLDEERAHIGSHLGVQLGDTMAEDQLRFLYFRMHDTDGDSKLDGCELVKSLLHFHHEETAAAGASEHSHQVKIFRNEELELMIDPVILSDDKNGDGFIDYPEFVAAQKTRGF